jgi:hypothetical protein
MLKLSPLFTYAVKNDTGILLHSELRGTTPEVGGGYYRKLAVYRLNAHTIKLQTIVKFYVPRTETNNA